MLKTKLSSALLLFALSAALALAGEPQTTAITRPKTEPANEFYVGNRPPLLPSPLVKLPIGAIEPRGWVRTQLELESEGFSGRLTEISEFLRKDGNAWLSKSGQGERGWEEVPYWLKGFGDLGYVLGDKRIIDEARIWIDGALASQRDDGYFGPKMNLTNIDGKYPDLWPHMIMLNALQSYYEYSGDKRVIDLMTKYFEWQLGVPEQEFMLPFWQQQRAADNLASVYWLYNRTPEPWLLELAAKIHRRTANWTDGVANWHGVNMSQAFRGPAEFYQQSKDKKHLDATWQRIADMWGAYGQVPGGGYGADENCREGHTGPRQGTETCTWAELMLSYEMLLKIDGDVRWADRCEEVAFNSLPASMTADLKALRYLTCPNEIQSDKGNKSPGIQNGGEMLSFNPHNYRCCQHNVAHAWPYYAEHLWMATAGNGLAAVMYAPCKVKAKVGKGEEVTIAEDTKYPFDENVTLTVSTAKPVQFPLCVRVPGWCKAPEVKVAGKPQAVKTGGPGAPGFILIDREWKDGDKVELRLPMQVTLRTWERNDDCVSVDRGPLTYSLKIGEKLVRYGGTDQWPAYDMLPTAPWNYGLVFDAKDPAKSFEVVAKTWDGVQQPFEVSAAPIELKARGKRIPQWKQDYLGLVGLLQPSPVKSAEPEETITLIPMGCARLRIASFPVISSGPDALEWTMPQEPIPATASYVNSGDTLNAISDEIIPKSSNDQKVPRFTWWEHKGTTEWVQYRFDPARKVQHVDVYWFDDRDGGGCRVSASWRVLYQVGEEWKPVTTKETYGVERDKFNGVTFDAVETTGLRLEVQLQKDYSGGILEWRVR